MTQWVGISPGYGRAGNGVPPAPMCDAPPPPEDATSDSSGGTVDVLALNVSSPAAGLTGGPSVSVPTTGLRVPEGRNTTGTAGWGRSSPARRVQRWYHDSLVFASRWVKLNGFEAVVERRIVDDYGAVSAFSKRERKAAFSTMWKMLDVDTGSRLVFWGDFNRMLQDPSVADYLAKVAAEMERATPQEPFDLWAYTLRATGDRHEAMRWMAVLFQTVDAEALLPLPDTAARHTLAAILPRFRDGDPSVILYPDGINIPRSVLYHYYVPAYLSRELVKAGVDPSLAFLSLATFNAEYEFHSHYAGNAFYDDSLEEVLEAFEDVTDIERGALSRMVERLRQRGEVDASFAWGDLSFSQDLALSRAQRWRLAEELVDEFDLQEGHIERLAREDSMHGMTNYIQAITQPSMVERSTYGYRFLRNGLRGPTSFSRGGMHDIWLGFMGAAEVLPGRRLPMGTHDLAMGVERDAFTTMLELWRDTAPAS